MDVPALLGKVVDAVDKLPAAVAAATAPARAGRKKGAGPEAEEEEGNVGASYGA